MRQHPGDPDEAVGAVLEAAHGVVEWDAPLAELAAWRSWAVGVPNPVARDRLPGAGEDGVEEVAVVVVASRRGDGCAVTPVFLWRDVARGAHDRDDPDGWWLPSLLGSATWSPKTLDRAERSWPGWGPVAKLTLTGFAPGPDGWRHGDAVPPAPEMAYRCALGMAAARVAAVEVTSSAGSRRLPVSTASGLFCVLVRGALRDALSVVAELDDGRRVGID